MRNAAIQAVKSEGTQNKRPRPKTNRIPDDLLRCIREDVAPEWEKGRAAYNIGTELSSAMSLVLELVLRKHQLVLANHRDVLRKHQQWLKELDLLVKNPRPPAPIRSMSPQRQETEECRMAQFAAALHREVA